jgi:hypothetical protein
VGCEAQLSVHGSLVVIERYEIDETSGAPHTIPTTFDATVQTVVDAITAG